MSMNNVNKLFNQVVDNIFESLFKSLDNIDNDPKISIITYYSALELLFKARLMYENWAFILEDLDAPKATFDNFKNGDFKTVTLESAAKRIRCLFKDLEPNYENHFSKLNTVRNKLIHFDSIAHDDNNLSLEAISESWFFVHELLNKKWNKLFENHKDKIEELNKKFEKYSTPFFKSKRNALLDRNLEKYKNNPEYKNNENCPQCKLNKIKYKNNDINLIKRFYNKEELCIKKHCDICEYEEVIESIPQRYLNNEGIINSILDEVKLYFENYKSSEWVRLNSIHDKLLLKHDKNTIADIIDIVKDYISDNIEIGFDGDVDIDLQEINETSSQLCCPMYVDFSISTNECCSAFYCLYLDLNIILNKNTEEIKNSDWDTVLNNISNHELHIKVDSDGF